MTTTKPPELPFEDEVLRRMLKTPPKRHDEMKKKAPAKKKPPAKRPASRKPWE